MEGGHQCMDGDDDLGQFGQCVEVEQGFFNLYFTPYIVDAEYLRGGIISSTLQGAPSTGGLGQGGDVQHEHASGIFDVVIYICI